jgi:Leucine-rich repeat (LRR) protein
MQNQIFIPRNEESHKNKTTPIMKKLFYILLLITGITNAQIVDIPDANFKAALIAYGVDTNADGQIQESEALNVINLYYLHNRNIADLTGIQSFTNLEELRCYQNNLSNLDLTGLVNLQTLDCYSNNLSNLDLTGLVNLQYLYCYNNNLTSLNVSGLNNLSYISCYGNSFTNLDFSGLSNLQSIDTGTVTNNFNLSNTGLVTLYSFSFGSVGSLNLTNCTNLTTILLTGDQVPIVNLTGCTALTYLEMESCGLQALDVSTLINLQTLSCSFNNFTSLDVSNNHNLTTLNCSSFALQYLYAKNGTEEQLGYTINGTPNLLFACVDDFQVGPLLSGPIGSPNAVISSYCSFTPGGNYNTISGTVTLDANNNGCDSNDIFQPNIRINVNEGTTQGATFSNNLGNYNFYTQAGSFVLTPAIENPTWFTFSPTTATIPFANNNNNAATQNFCLSANGVHPDVEIVIAPITPARPGFDATYKIVYKNKGNLTLSGNVSFTYDDTVLDFVSATLVPNSQSVGTMSWNYTNLLPFESRSIEIVFNVNAPTETPAVNIGDVLNFSATVNPIADDEIPSDNTFNYNETVVGSYDPNDITCLEGDIVAPSEIGNYLHYNIRFENTGTAPAEFVVVKVEVNQTDFDMNSLQIMNSSDPVDARINQNIVEFIFQNIQLESGGHGNILLKIKSKNNLLVGDEVNKKANIYFDYNFPILTNDAETVFQSLNNPDFQNDSSISVYPNPTNGIVTVNCNNSIKSIQLYDVQGRLLQTNLVNENETTIDVSTKAKGVYFLKILSDKGMKVEKIVRE